MSSTLPTRANPVLTVNAAKTGALYIPQDRRRLVTLLVTVLAAIVLVAAGVWLYFWRSSQASAALADAMRTYDTQVVPAGQPVPAGTRTFNSDDEKARVSNGEFASVASKYGLTPAGRDARYLQAVTAQQMGQTATAENLFKQSADSWNADISSLAKLSLAGLYHGSNRDADAIKMLEGLAAKPTTAVPAGLAQLQLADLYSSEGKKDQARKIYAQIKDKDPKSAAAEIAGQKLGDAPAR